MSADDVRQPDDLDGDPQDEGPAEIELRDGAGNFLELIRLEAGETISLGSNPGNTVVLDDAEIGRYHLQLQFDGLDLLLIDLGSVSGTLIDGEEVEPHIAVPWDPGILVRVGSFVMRRNDGFLEEQPQEPGEPAVLVAAPPPLQFVEPDSLLRQQLTPGTPTTLVVTVRNDSLAPVQVLLELSGLPPEWVTLPTASATLDAGTAGAYNILVNVPRTSAATATDYAVLLRARTRDDRAGAAELAAIWTVDVFEAIEIDLKPRRAVGRGQVDFRIALHNLGNARSSYKINLRDESGALDLIAQPLQIPLDAGRRGEIRLSAQPLEPPSKRVQARPFSLQAVSARGTTSESISGQLMQQRQLPSWVVPLIVMLLLFSLIPLVFWLNQREADAMAAAAVASGTILVTEVPTETPDLTEIETATAIAATAFSAQTATAVYDASDSDRDGLANKLELQLGLNPDSADTDGDGISDAQELNVYRTDPLNPDTDLDGLPDGQEVQTGTNPLSKDTDGDGIEDNQDDNSLNLPPPTETPFVPAVAAAQAATRQAQQRAVNAALIEMGAQPEGEAAAGGETGGGAGGEAGGGAGAAETPTAEAAATETPTSEPSPTTTPTPTATMLPNERPLLNVPPSVTGGEKDVIEFEDFGLADPDVGAGLMRISLSVNEGNLKLGYSTGLTFLSAAQNESSLLDFTGTITNVRLALNSLTYQGSGTFNGVDTLSVQVSDQGNTGSGGSQTATGSVRITLREENDKPFVGRASMSAVEGVLTPISATMLNIIDPDDEPDVIQITLASVPAGTLFFDGTALTAGATFTKQNIIDGVLSYQSLTGQSSATDSFSFTMDDDEEDSIAPATGTMNIAITGMVPRLSGVASRDFYPGAAVTLMPSLTVIDPDGSGLVTMTLTLNNPLNGAAEQLILSSGAITGGLVADNNGTVLTLRPQTGRTASLSAFVATARQIAYNNTAGTLDRSASRRMTLALRDDSGLIATIDFDVTIDDPIRLTGGTLPTTDEDTLSPVLGSALIISDTNIASSGQIRLSLSLNNATPRIVSSSVVTGPITSGGTYSTTQLVTGTLSALNSALQTMQILPNSDFFGTIQLYVSVVDLTSGASGVSSETSLTMTVTAVNDEPTFSLPAGVTCIEDSACTLTISSILAGPANERSGIGAQTISFSASLTDTAVLAVPDMSSYNGVAGSYSLPLSLISDASGVRELTISAIDDGPDGAPNDNRSQQSVIVTVTNINDRPVFTGIVNNLDAIAEDSPAPDDATDGTPVSSLFRAPEFPIPGSVSDPDNSMIGIAITFVETHLNGNGGTWYYRLAGDGQVWTAFPEVSNSALLLLGPNDRIAYLPPANIAGTLSPALTYYAWDMSSGSTGSQVPYVDNPASSLSVETRSSTLSVSAVNDRPVLQYLNDVTFSESQLVTQALVIDTLVEVTDIDSADFLAGGITATWLADGSSSDQLSIVSGNGVTISGRNIAVYGTTVAQIPAANGNNGSDLYIEFTAPITPTIVETLIEAIGYRTTSQKPVLMRTLGLTVGDGDGGVSVQRTAVITVTPSNSPPTISSISAQATNEDTVSAPISFTISDAEDTATQLSVSVTGGDSNLVTPAGLVLSSSGSVTDTLTVTPVANAFGATLITVTLTDSEGAQSSTNFTLTVNPVNDAPTFTAPASATYSENTPSIVLYVTQISAGPLNETTVSGQTVSVTANSSNPALIPNAAVNYDGVSDQATLTLTPVTNAAGSVTFTVRAVDSGSAVPPNVNTTSATFVITLTNVNNPPVITGSGNALSPISEDQGAPSGDVGSLVGNLLSGQASDADGTSSFGIAVSATAGGSWYYRPSGGSWTPFPAVSGSAALLLAPADQIYLQPTANFSGTVSSALTYYAWDRESGTAGSVIAPTYSVTGTFSAATTSSSVTVVGSNDAPTLSGLNSVTFSESQVYNSAALIDSSVLLADIDSTDLSGGEVSVSYSAGSTSSDQLTIISGADVQRSGTTIFYGFTTIIGTISDSASDGSNGRPLLITLSNGTLPTQARALVEALGYGNTSTTPALTRTLAVTVSDGDGGTSLPATATITVTPVNSAPTISSIAAQTVAEDGSLSGLNFTIADIDHTTGELSVSASSSNATLLPPGSLVLSKSGSVTDTLSITPAANAFGTALITLTVTDSFSPPASSATSFTLTVTAVNDSPTISATTAISDGVRQLPDEPATVGLLITDVENGPALTITLASSDTTLVPLSNLLLSGNDVTRTLTITPAAGLVGSSVITVSASDGEATTAISFTVFFNGPPQIIGDAADGSISTQNSARNELLVMDWGFVNGTTAAMPPNTDFLIVDADQSLSQLTLSAVSSNTSVLANTDISFNAAAGTLTLDPANTTGTTIVTLRVYDGVVTTTRSFSYIVEANGANDAPTIGGTRAITVSEDSSGTFNFTVSDAETASTALHVQATTLTTTLLPQSNLLLSGNGTNRTLLVTPTADLFGTAYISVTISDGAITSTNRLTLTVTSLNDLPTIGAIDDVTINEDSSSGALSFSVSDLESSAFDLTLSGASSNTTVVPNGNIVFGGSGTNRTVTVTPAANQYGSVTISVGVSDGTDTVTRTFLLTVLPQPDAPSVSSPGNITVLEDVAPAPRDVIISDAETAAAELTIAISSSNTALVASNAVTLTGTTITRTLLITPTANAFGTTVISFTVTDGDGMSTSRSFVLTVLSVNDLPTISSVANQTISEDSSLNLNLTVGDVETAVSQLIVSAVSSNEAVIAAGDITIGTAVGSSVPLTITPAANVNGSSTITLTVTDLNGGSATSVFNLTVSAVNDLPTISSLADLTITEDQSAGPISFVISDTETALSSLVLLKDSGNTALVPLNRITFGGSSTDVTRTVTITPTANAFGSSLISIGLSDGSSIVTETFTLTVTSLNDAPTVSSIAPQSINEDGVFGPLSFTVNDIEDGSALTVTVTVADSPADLIDDANVLLAGSGLTRTLTITPTANTYGSALITLNVTDSNGTTSVRSFALTVNAVNDAPTIAPAGALSTAEDTALSFSTVISDSETSPPSLLVTVVSSDQTLLPDSNIVIATPTITGFVTVTVTPAANLNGSTTLTLTVSDGSASDSTTTLLTVSAVNDVPSIATIADRTIAEDQSTGLITFTVDDSDTPLSALTMTSTSSNPALVPENPANISIGLIGSSSVTRTLIVTPTANAFGSSLISIGLSDGTTTVTETFTLTVNAVNDAPTVSSIAPQSIPEDGVLGPLSFTVNDIEDGSALTVTVTVADSPADLIDDANVLLAGSGLTRTLTITPTADKSGTALVTLNVTDSGGITTTRSFNLAVTAVNDAPTAIALSSTSVPSGTVSGTTIGTFSTTDVDSSSFTYSLVSGDGDTDNANFAIVGDELRSAVDFTGAATYSIRVQSSDGGLSFSRTFTITVTP